MHEKKTNMLRDCELPASGRDAERASAAGCDDRRTARTRWLWRPRVRGPDILALGLALLVAACGGTTDVAGEYTISLTNRDNGCAFADWEVGKTSTGIPVSITQDGSAVTAVVGGLSATFLDLWLGAHVFQGAVSGSAIELRLYGTRSRSQGNCAFTINSTIEAEIDGDLMTGSIIYTAATNQNPDCGTLQGCQSRQDFNGTRPPR